VLFQGGRFRLRFGPLGLQPLGGGDDSGPPGPVRVERLVPRRFPPAGLVEGGARLAQRRFGPVAGLTGFGGPSMRLLGGGRRGADGGAAGMPGAPAVEPVPVGGDDDQVGIGESDRQRLLPRPVDHDRGPEQPAEDGPEPGNRAPDAPHQRPRHRRRARTGVPQFRALELGNAGRGVGDEDRAGGAGRAEAGQGSPGGIGVAGDHAPQGFAEGGGDGGLGAGFDCDQVDDGPQQAVDPVEGGGEAGAEVAEGGVEGVGPGRPAVDVGVGGPTGLVGFRGLLLGRLPGQPGRLQGRRQRRLVELFDPGGRLVFGQAGQSAPDRLPAANQSRLLRLRAGHDPGERRQLGPGLGRRLAGREVPGGVDLCPADGQGLLDGLDLGLAGGEKGALVVGAGQVGPELGRLGGERLDHPGVGQGGQGPVDVAPLLRHQGAEPPGPGQQRLGRRHGVAERVGRKVGQCRLRFRHLGFQPPGLLPGDGLLGPEPLPLLPQGALPFGQAGDLPAGQVQPDGVELLGQPAVAAGGVGLALEGLQVAADFLHQVAEALEVDGRRLQPPLGLLLALPVLEDPGRLLDDRPPVLRAGLEDGVEAPLAHDHVLRAPHAGVGQQLGDVEEPAGLPVDGVARLAVPRQAAGDRHLPGGDRDQPAGVVEGQRHLGLPRRRPLRRAGEDDVLHLAAPQRAGALGAEDPGHGVDDVGLPRPVGADHDGDARLEIERRPVGERLEALHGETLEEHRRSNLTGPPPGGADPAGVPERDGETSAESEPVFSLR
jgi:hypothetical protein